MIERFKQLKNVLAGMPDMQNVAFHVVAEIGEGDNMELEASYHGWEYKLIFTMENAEDILSNPDIPIDMESFMCHS